MCVKKKCVYTMCVIKKGVSRKRMCVKQMCVKKKNVCHTQQKKLQEIKTYRDLRHTKNEIMQPIYVEAAKQQMCVTHGTKNLKKLRHAEGCTPIQSCSPSMYKTQNTKLASHTKKKPEKSRHIEVCTTNMKIYRPPI